MLNKSFLCKTNNFVFSFDKYAKIIFEKPIKLLKNNLETI